MSKKDDSGDIPSSQHMNIVDPLGVIQARAKELWTEAGEPENRSWTYYWPQAEANILAARDLDNADADADENLDAGLDTSELLNTLTHIIKDTFSENLIDHEAVCLANILQNHQVILKNEKSIDVLTISETARVISSLSIEYSLESVQAMKAQEATTVPIPTRIKYWTRKLNEIEKRDDPLTFTDRNTIRRLKDRLSKQKQVSELIYRGGRPQLVCSE